jgi:hypothetical protein
MFHKQQGGKVDAKRCGDSRLPPISWRAEFLRRRASVSPAAAGKLQLDLRKTRATARSFRVSFDQSQPETFVVMAPRKLATAGKTSDGATNPAHAWEFTPAIAAAIKVTASQLA